MIPFEIIAAIHEALQQRDYVVITPDYQVLVGKADALAEHMRHLAVLEDLPTTGVTKQ